ncbi:MAG: hypothetical protein WC849_02410 [Candidatus Paceibacterota bacterium]
MLTNNDRDIAVKEKSEEIDQITKILEDREKDFAQLTENLEKLEEVQTAVQKIMGSFSELYIKQLVTDAHKKIASEIKSFKETRESFDELISRLDKMAEVDVVVGAIEIATRDIKDSELSKNLDKLVSYIKENGTGDNSLVLLSRASWKW